MPSKRSLALHSGTKYVSSNRHKHSNNSAFICKIWISWINAHYCGNMGLHIKWETAGPALVHSHSHRVSTSGTSPPPSTYLRLRMVWGHAPSKVRPYPVHFLATGRSSHHTRDCLKWWHAIMGQCVVLHHQRNDLYLIAYGLIMQRQWDVPRPAVWERLQLVRNWKSG